MFRGGDFTPFLKEGHATSLNEFRHMPQRQNQVWKVYMCRNKK